MEGAFQRRPGPHPGAGAGPLEVDRGVAAEGVAGAVLGEDALVGAPAQFRRLAALADEAVDRPGVDELAGPLGDVGRLGVALGDVDDLDPEIAGQRPPVGADARRAAVGDVPAGVAGDVEQGELDEVGDEAGVGAVGDDRGRRRGLGLQRQGGLAQGVVRPLRRGQRRIDVGAGPGLDAGVEVERAALAAELDERHRRDLDRDVDEEVVRPEQRLEQRRGSCRGSPAAPGSGRPAASACVAAALVGGDDA